MCAGWVAPVRLSAISHLPSASHLAPEAAAAQSQQYQLGRSAATAHKFIRSLWQLPRLHHAQEARPTRCATASRLQLEPDAGNQFGIAYSLGMDFCFQQGIGEETSIEVEKGIRSREEGSEGDREEGKVLYRQ